MANKTKKKRDKAYRGADAAVTQPKVTRVSVPNRSKFGEWWHENRKKLGLRALSIIVIGTIFLVIYLLVSWIF